MMKSPISHFHFQQFDYSSYLAYKREGFVGRKWFFLEMENFFEKERGRTAGVLITGEPGSGKSALMSQLICSPFSSLLIHNNIIGYHLCEYSEKGKRDGARFVRNLVDQIAARLPEYSEHVINNEQMRRQLDDLCQQDPTGCFFTSILGPLRKLKQPEGLRYIVIDALDECFETDKTSDIIEILNSKIPHFPKWLKVILTSRNLTTVTTKIPRMVTRTPLYATDERNVKDIRYYVSRFISQNSFFTDRLLAAVNITSRADGIKMFLDEVITRAEGNFLFVKMTLQYMNDTNDEVVHQSLPTTLFDLYNIFFNRQFGKDGFGPFRSLFEVLLAVSSPLRLDDAQEILKREYDAEDISQLIEQASCFLRFGRDGTVRIYHQSFAEWLMNQTNVYINKTRGHQNIARFLLQRIRERCVNVTFGELTELFMHILSGRTLEIHGTAIDLFNITEMREPQTNMSILHNLATKPSMYLPVLDFFLRKFKTVDILDASKKTPAFYAASEGFVENLERFINRGADVSSFLEGLTKLDQVSVVIRNTGIEEFSLMHAAAAKGHKDVVELLIKSNVSFPEASKNYPTPLHLAAGNGFLEIVRLFYNYNIYDIRFDQITLHHAAARNHSNIVRFLLTTAGVCDRCLPCLSKAEHVRPTAQDVQLYFCETALHAAVSRGYINVVKLLLAFGKEALECKHHSGKTVLMDAVEKNDTNMVDLLLENEANVTAECGSKLSKDMCSLPMYKLDSLYTVYGKEGCTSCKCGNRPIHVSAIYGLWEVAKKLTSKRAHVFDITILSNCCGQTALYLAISRGHTNFLYHTNETYKEYGSYLLDESLVKTAMYYCSTNAMKRILNYPVYITYEQKWKLLLDSIDYWWSVLYYNPVQSFLDPCLDDFEEAVTFSLGAWMRRVTENRLAITKLLIESYENTTFFLHKKDANDGMTLLHHAAQHGFEDAVKYLCQIGANIQTKDRNGKSALSLALKFSPTNPGNSKAWYRCYTTNDGQFGSCNSTNYDETVRYLIWSHGSNISKCDAESATMLKVIVEKQMPLSLYALLKAGVDVNCKLDESVSPFLHHLGVGERQLSEVFKIFKVGISFMCGDSFTSSELHLMSYLSVPGDFGNLFKPSLNNTRFPLQRLLDAHPIVLSILNKCYDAEGYLPIHRAAQGGNLAAIKWFRSIGLDFKLETRTGLTALDISILYLGNIIQAELIAPLKSTPYSWRRSNRGVPLTTSKYRKQVFEELLRTFFSTMPEYKSEFPCGSKLEGLSPLHIAAVKGMTVLEYVHKTISEMFPSLQLNCANKHRVDPVYLARFYESLKNEGLVDKYFEDDSNVNFKQSAKTFKTKDAKNSEIESEIETGTSSDGTKSDKETPHGTVPPVQYPDREVDYYMAFNYLYHPSCFNITDKMLHCKIPKDIRIHDCPGYYDSTPKFEETVPVDFSECSKLQACHEYYEHSRSLCESEMVRNHYQKYPCPTMIKRLQSCIESRRNRNISQFIAKIIGWDDVPRGKDMHNRWPFYFLHNYFYLNKYKSYGYLNILNEALEVADVRFYSRVDPLQIIVPKLHINITINFGNITSKLDETP